MNNINWKNELAELLEKEIDEITVGLYCEDLLEADKAKDVKTLAKTNGVLKHMIAQYQESTKEVIDSEYDSAWVAKMFGKLDDGIGDEDLEFLLRIYPLTDDGIEAAKVAATKRGWSQEKISRFATKQGERVASKQTTIADKTGSAGVTDNVNRLLGEIAAAMISNLESGRTLLRELRHKFAIQFVTRPNFAAAVAGASTQLETVSSHEISDHGVECLDNHKIRISAYFDAFGTEKVLHVFAGGSNIETAKIEANAESVSIELDWHEEYNVEAIILYVTDKE